MIRRPPSSTLFPSPSLSRSFPRLQDSALFLFLSTASPPPPAIPSVTPARISAANAAPATSASAVRIPRILPPPAWVVAIVGIELPGAKNGGARRLRNLLLGLGRRCWNRLGRRCGEWPRGRLCVQRDGNHHKDESSKNGPRWQLGKAHGLHI